MTRALEAVVNNHSSTLPAKEMQAAKTALHAGVPYQQEEIHRLFDEIVDDWDCETAG